MAISGELYKYLLAAVVIVIVVVVLGYFHQQTIFTRKIKIFLNILTLIAAAAWLLSIFGKLDLVIETISRWIH